MKNATSLIAFATAAVLAGGVNIAAAQDPAPHTPSPQAPTTQAPTPANAPMDADRADKDAKSVTGELVKVDVDAKTVAIKDASGKEHTFSYTASTDVAGSTDVSGLATKAGSKVKVHFTGEGASRVATKIETMDDEKK